MMINRVLRCTALLLVFFIISRNVASASKPLDGPSIREQIAAIGEGQQCRLKLMDGTQAKGMIVSIHADYLTLKTKAVDEPRRIDYVQIIGVHKAGRLSDAKVALTVGAVSIGVITGLAIWFWHVWMHS